jgi:hypothetical protein
VFKKQLIEIQGKKPSKEDIILGWNSRIRLSYKTAEDLNEEKGPIIEHSDAARRKPVIWFWKTENATRNKEECKLFTLNIFEVTIPFG